VTTVSAGGGGRGGTATSAQPTETKLARRGRLVVGGFFLSTGGVHLGIVAASTEFYRHFADIALFSFVREGWAHIFMATPVFWGLCLFAGETLLGVLLLCGGRWARLGWVGVIGFHVLLMLFGFGFWLWCVPALVILVLLARVDWPYLTPRRT
jgi:hypothetical protein